MFLLKNAPFTLIAEIDLLFNIQKPYSLTSKYICDNNIPFGISIMELELRRSINYTPLQIQRFRLLHRVTRMANYFERNQGYVLSCIDNGEQLSLIVTPKVIEGVKRIGFSLYLDLCLTGEFGVELAKGVMEHMNQNSKTTAA